MSCTRVLCMTPPRKQRAAGAMFPVPAWRRRVRTADSVSGRAAYDTPQGSGMTVRVAHTGMDVQGLWADAPEAEEAVLPDAVVVTSGS
ncbi:hypothetical protein C8Q78DRAFT_317029 [Trametes maxima]|nr:hypothetical protein C8Q78DRAFT_317029 [Trametes maxima]